VPRFELATCLPISLLCNTASTYIPPALQPATHQQTLRRSFTIGGIGLHGGEQALVRVMPAFAGEGRYFVQVPTGTNVDSWQMEQPQSFESQGAGMGRGALVRRGALGHFAGMICQSEQAPVYEFDCHIPGCRHHQCQHGDAAVL
jgi:hypothetical protein